MKAISQYGAAYAGWDADPTRVRLTVVTRTGRQVASLTPAQARALAVKLLQRSERASRKGATALRIVRAQAEAS